jgi:hypothetical protein
MANQVDPATTGDTAASGVAGPGQVLTDHGAAAVDIGQSGPSGVATPASGTYVGPYPSFHGRRVSWVSISVVIAGFLIGGFALIFSDHGHSWWLFWTGTGVAVVGLLMMIFTNTFQDWY